jgi:diguanylate cyclase (GGDEF)-like protein
MVQLVSLPLIVTSSISLILGAFFMLLFFRLKNRYEESVRYYFIFSLSALVSGVFLGAFSILINSGDNLDYLNISNRIAIIAAMFTTVLGLHFYISFFDYRAPRYLKWCYAICSVFSVITLIPTRYFLAKEFHATSDYYTGLAFGPLFELWGAWILVLAAYCLTVLVRVYLRQIKRAENQSLGTVQLLLAATVIWMIAGVSDTLTAIQLFDLPPLTWIGSFLVTCCSAWILVLHIDDLYEDRRQLNQRLMYDHLTKAFSRSYFEIRLAEELKTMAEDESYRLHVCLFDIDDFKTVNDQYGHAMGDELLKGIAEITNRIIRPKDCLARLGGDEFVLLLSDLDKEQAYELIENIRHSIHKTPFGLEKSMFHATCSFGLVSSSSEHLVVEDLANQLLSHADEALYVSKHQGKNRLVSNRLPTH